MAKITWLGGEENGNVATNQWGRYLFVINQPLEVNDPHIVAKARGNRFFKVGDVSDGMGADCPMDFAPVTPKVHIDIVPDDPADDEPMPPGATERPVQAIQEEKPIEAPPKPKRRGRPPKAKVKA